MIHSFYFRFFKKTGNERLSILLSYAAYLVFFFKYLCQRVKGRKRIIRMDTKTALRRISKIHPDSGKAPVTNPAPLNANIDLSIIIPVYNYADLIERNIQSVLNQKTEYQFELILVDDGSTDGAADILRKYENVPNVRVIFQENQGIAGARNTGLNAAAGRYFMFIDCDDTVENNLVETLMSKAIKEDLDMVMCAHKLAKERDGQVYEVLPNIYSSQNLQGYAESAAILNYAGLPWCKVYKRELWEKVRYFPGYWYEDTIIHGLIFTQCKSFAYVPEVCYQYRWYEKNFSHTQGNSADVRSIDMFWLMRAMLRQYEQMNLPRDERFETMLLKHLSVYYYSKVKDLDTEDLEALFVLACSLYRRCRVKTGCQLPYMLRVTKKALLRRDINLWKLASMYQR